MISTQSTTPTFLAGTAQVPAVQGVQSIQGVQGMPAPPNAFGINPAGNGVQPFAPQTPPTQAWATQGMPAQVLPTTAPTDASSIDDFVRQASRAADTMIAQSTAQQAQQQQALLLQQQQRHEESARVGKQINRERWREILDRKFKSTDSGSKRRLQRSS